MFSPYRTIIYFYTGVQSILLDISVIIAAELNWGEKMHMKSWQTTAVTLQLQYY